MYLGKLLLRGLLKINENENDDCITSYMTFTDLGKILTVNRLDH